MGEDDSGEFLSETLTSVEHSTFLSTLYKKLNPQRNWFYTIFLWITVAWVVMLTLAGTHRGLTLLVSRCKNQAQSEVPAKAADFV